MRILIVEDHEMFREVIRKVCRTHERHSVVGEVGSLRQAKDVLAAEAPELTILDLGLPDGEGFDLIATGRNVSPRTKYLVVSAHCDAYTVFRLGKAKIDGFVDKSTGTMDALRQALTEIAQGGCYFSKCFQTCAMSLLTGQRPFFAALSEMELRIFRLVALGMDDREIGQLLDISPLTAKTHRARILHKLQIPNTPKLMRYAQEQGVVLCVKR